MNNPPKWMRISGLTCHIIVGGIMLLACGMKASGKMPMSPEDVARMTKWGVYDKLQMIGIGGVISAVLLLIPRTSFLGSLAVSSYWGGAILLHMIQNESYVVPAALVLLTWAGAILRHPSAFLTPDRGRLETVSI